MTAETAVKKSKFTPWEAIVLMGIAIAGFTLLLPMLPASRENARSSLCRYNLRQMDLATIDYVSNHRRLPDANTWPVELLPQLMEANSQDRLRLGMDIFIIPRPRGLTCPSHPNATATETKNQTGNYVFVIDRTKASPVEQAKWTFRDRERAPSVDANKPWYVGIELTPGEAERQTQEALGPHGQGLFFESDGQGQVHVARAP